MFTRFFLMGVTILSTNAVTLKLAANHYLHRATSAGDAAFATLLVIISVVFWVIVSLWEDD